MPRAFKLGLATRAAYGQTLVELGRERRDIVVLDADLSKSTQTGMFQKEHPDRFINCGIAEANMVSMAAGLAAAGKVPFVSSFACFLMCKGHDQLRMSVAYPGFNVKVVTSHAGISIGEDGPSQQGIEDVALALALPGFTVLVPCDETQTRDLVRRAAAHPGPVYLRTGRPRAPIVYEKPEPFPFGKARVHGFGRDVTIIANGLEVAESLKAQELLRERGLDAGVVDMYSVRPLDEEAVEEAARASGAILVAEEHLVWGGLGATVAQAAARRKPVPMGFVGLTSYAESGTPEELMEAYGLTAPSIARAAEALVARKG